MSETFQLGFRTEGPTRTLNHNAEDYEVKAALEELSTADVVDVSRQGPFPGNTYIWTVAFEKSRTLTQYGYRVDDGQNLAALHAYTVGQLAGTNARIEVEHVAICSLVWMAKLAKK